MSHLPLVSVVIPTYNRSALVSSAVDSALGQTYPSVEVIVVDDGSTDSTQSRLAVYGDRIRVVRQANAGPAAAMNRGVSLARGEFVSFLGSDDVYLPRFVESCVSLLLRAGSGVPCCITNAVLQRANGRNGLSFENAGLRPQCRSGLWVNVPEVLLTRFVVSAQTMLVRREELVRAQGFDEGLRYLEDYKMALRLSTAGPWAFLSEPLVVWQQSADSLSRRAINERRRVNECRLRAIEGMTPFLAQPVGRKLARLHAHALRRAQGDLATDLRWQTAEPGPGLVLYHGALAAARRTRDACWRRAPWYPGMDTVMIEEWCARHTS